MKRSPPWRQGAKSSGDRRRPRRSSPRSPGCADLRGPATRRWTHSSAEMPAGCAARRRQGRPCALGRWVPRLAVSHRRARATGRVRRPAPGRGSLVRLRRVDRRRVLLPEATAPARGQARRRDHGRRLRPLVAGSQTSSSPACARTSGAESRECARRRGCSCRDTRAPTGSASCSRSCSTDRCARAPASGGCRSDRQAGRPRGRLLVALRELAARGEGADDRAQRDDAEHRSPVAVHRFLDGRAAGRQ